MRLRVVIDMFGFTGKDLIFIGMILVAVVLLANPHCAEAGWYLELGAYHRLDTTDRLLLSDDKYGSDTMGTIDVGYSFHKCWFAHRCDVGVHHQSYIDRGWLIPGILDFGGEETYIDGAGVRLRWEW